MKKRIKYLLALFSIVILAACGNEGGEPPEEGASDNSLNVALIINGTGDMSFNDSAVAGLEKAEEDFGDQFNHTVIEYGYDPADIEPNFLDAADNSDINTLILPSQFVDTVAKFAPDYPDKEFWLYGTTFPFEEGQHDNVYAMNYRSNEASYLGGYLAASTSDSGVLGFLGGIDNNIINDFLVGYMAGAEHANPEIKIMTSYVGNFEDSARGKDLGLAMYDNGASLAFNVAGAAGVGLIEAAVESDTQALGVDSDQAAMYDSQGQTEFAEVIPTSVLTNVGETIHRAIDLSLKDELQVGQLESLGLAENAVGLADNEFFRKAYSEELIAEVEGIKQQIIDGEIEVPSTYSLSADEINSMRDAVAP